MSKMTQRIVVNIPDDLLAFVKQRAAQDNRPLAQYIRHMLYITARFSPQQLEHMRQYTKPFVFDASVFQNPIVVEGDGSVPGA